MHVIRLHAAWEQKSATEYRRRFNTPTGLTKGDQVWLICDTLDDVEQIMLNEKSLSMETESRWEINACLRSTGGNVLTMISTAPKWPQTIDTIRLEILEAKFDQSSK